MAFILKTILIDLWFYSQSDIFAEQMFPFVNIADNIRYGDLVDFVSLSKRFVVHFDSSSLTVFEHFVRWTIYYLSLSADRFVIFLHYWLLRLNSSQGK
jgi:hypothetical protein